MKTWELKAIQELSAIIYEISYRQYESKQDIINALKAAADCLSLTADVEQPETRNRGSKLLILRAVPPYPPETLETED